MSTAPTSTWARSSSPAPSSAHGRADL